MSDTLYVSRGERRISMACKNVECISCDEGDPANECAESEGDCGHHCNHIWTHDECCWCGKNEQIDTEETENGQ